MQWLLFLLWVVPRYTFLLIQPHYWLAEYFSRYKGVPVHPMSHFSPVSPMHACMELCMYMNWLWTIFYYNGQVEGETNKTYLCDLGLAHVKQYTMTRTSSSTLVTWAGSIPYMPPEAFGKSPKAGKMVVARPSDIWSLACTLLVLFTGEKVWPQHCQPGTIIGHLITESDVTPDGVGKLTGKIKTILKPCFNKDPKMRPTAEELLQGFSSLP